MDTSLPRNGFTLLEMLVVLMIIAILALMALPLQSQRVIGEQLREARAMADTLKPAIRQHWQQHEAFPVDNAEAGLPDRTLLISNYVAGIQVADGALHIAFGHKAHPQLQGRTLSLRPLTVDGSPASPIDWSCGHAQPPAGMSAGGDNHTDVPTRWLPLACRASAQHGTPE